MYYTRSNGSQELISEMQYPHLKSATAKLEREIGSQPHRVEELQNMKTEMAAREAAYAEEQASAQQTGG